MKKPSIVVGDLFKILCQFYYVLAVQFTLSKIFVLSNSHVHYEPTRDTNSPLGSGPDLGPPTYNEKYNEETRQGTRMGFVSDVTGTSPPIKHEKRQVRPGVGGT